jgi:chromosome segregation ATPase
MSTAAPTSDLVFEIRTLQGNLAAAERARIRPEDQRVTELQQKLAEAQHALQVQQVAEGLAIAEQQHAKQLALLAETEKAIDHAKDETVALRRELDELPQRLSRAHYNLGQLLRQRAQMKLDLGI